MAAIPDTVFASNGPVIISVKGTGTCTGNVTDGVNTAAVTAIKFSLTNDPGHLGGTSEATCTSLVLGVPPSTAEYDTAISYVAAPGFKVAPTTVTDQVIPPVTFNITGGTVSGSFAGGTASASGVPDATTVGAVAQARSDVVQPNPGLPAVPADAGHQDQEGCHDGCAQGSQGSEEDRDRFGLHIEPELLAQRFIRRSGRGGGVRPHPLCSRHLEVRPAKQACPRRRGTVDRPVDPGPSLGRPLRVRRGGREKVIG